MFDSLDSNLRPTYRLAQPENLIVYIHFLSLLARRETSRKLQKPLLRLSSTRDQFSAGRLPRQGCLLIMLSQSFSHLLD